MSQGDVHKKVHYIRVVIVFDTSMLYIQDFSDGLCRRQQPNIRLISGNIMSLKIRKPRPKISRHTIVKRRLAKITSSSVAIGLSVFET
jgi:hypothetical protein